MSGELVGSRRRHSGRSPSDRRSLGEKVLAARNRGVKMHEVAKELGIGEATADRYMKLALEARIAPTVDEFRRQQNDRLDETMRRAEEQVDAANSIIADELAKRGTDDRPNVSVILAALRERANGLALALRVDERRARLNGLDAPTVVNATVHQVDAEDVELAELIREEQARAAAEQPKETT